MNAALINNAITHKGVYHSADLGFLQQPVFSRKSVEYEFFCQVGPTKNINNLRRRQSVIIIFYRIQDGLRDKCAVDGAGLQVIFALFSLFCSPVPCGPVGGRHDSLIGLADNDHFCLCAVRKREGQLELARPAGPGQSGPYLLTSEVGVDFRLEPVGLRGFRKICVQPVCFRERNADPVARDVILCLNGHRSERDRDAILFRLRPGVSQHFVSGKKAQHVNHFAGKIIGRFRGREQFLHFLGKGVFRSPGFKPCVCFVQYFFFDGAACVL